MSAVELGLRLSSEPLITLLALLLFYLAINAAWLKYRDKLRRKGIEVSLILVIFRSSRFNSAIEAVGKRLRGPLKALSLVGILAGLYLMATGCLFLHSNLLSYLTAGRGEVVSPLIPGVTVSLAKLPSLAVAFLLAILPHELMHGVVASSENIKLKSGGILLLGPFVGGFIEPDEDELKRASLLAKVRVFSAGSFANFLVYLALVALASIAIHPVGVLVLETLEGFPAHGKLAPGDIIVALNGTKVSSLSELSAFMDRTVPGRPLKVRVLRRGRAVEVTLVLAPSPNNSSRGFMGVKLSDYYPNPELYDALWWSIIVSISVAVINMIPLYPLDGGLILNAILSRMLGNTKVVKAITYAVSIYFASLIVANIALSLSSWGLVMWP